MSLNFSFEKSNFAKLTEADRADNDLYIWGCLTVDMNSITEKNADEWHWRFAFYSKLFGSIYNKKGTDGKYHDYVPSLEEVKKRIGLGTNVSQKTRNQFVAKMVRMWKPITIIDEPKTISPESIDGLKTEIAPQA